MLVEAAGTSGGEVVRLRVNSRQGRDMRGRSNEKDMNDTSLVKEKEKKANEHQVEKECPGLDFTRCASTANDSLSCKTRHLKRSAAMA